MTVFKLHMLPARHGDCLVLQYGADAGSSRWVLIDGGTSGTYEDLKDWMAEAMPDPPHFELAVITHVDADHIAGALKLFEEGAFRADDVWFNGYRHLPDTPLEEFGPVQGERLSTMLVNDSQPWNAAFDGEAVVVQAGGELPLRNLPGGLTLTVLSPTPVQLAKLKPVWESKCKEAGLDPTVTAAPPEEPAGLESFGPINVEALAATDFQEDHSEANGSSIALLASFGGYSVLLAGDAFPSVLRESIRRLKPTGRLSVGAFKTPHHGSKANLDEALIDVLECGAYLISTSGAYFQHPDQEAIARILKFNPFRTDLYFNYRTNYTKVWDNQALIAHHDYRAIYRADDAAALTVDLTQ